METVSLPKILLEANQERQFPEVDPDRIVDELFQVRIGYLPKTRMYHANIHSIFDNKDFYVVKEGMRELLKGVREGIAEHHAALKNGMNGHASGEPRIIIPDGYDTSIS